MIIKKEAKEEHCIIFFNRVGDYMENDI